MPRPRKVTSVPPTVDHLKPFRRNIAIVGCYPESWEDAPFEDENWEIWGFSRKNMGKLPRCDKWFELHHVKNFPRYETEVKGYGEALRTAVLQADFPKDELVRRFGPFFFGSGQAPWLLAYAIMQGPKRIGLWGIEALDPLKPQRWDIQHFAQVAHDLGIQIVVPKACTLLHPRPLYGFESNKAH